MFEKLKRLKEKGYSPDTVLDIGAHQGYWTDSCMTIYENANYFLFEAIDYPHLKRFQSNKIQVFNVLLNDEIKEVDWYEMRNTGDSIFKELNTAFTDCEPIKKISYTLNSVVQEHAIVSDSKNILIKIDCQGAEIPILKGASTILDRTDFIILEIPLFGQYNAGVPNFLEHIQYMDSIGFVPYDILDEHMIHSFCMQVDMMFIHKKHEFNSRVQKFGQY